VEHGSVADGKSLREVDLRNKTGATLLAIRRDCDIIEQPVPETLLRDKDIAYLLGNPEQLNFASELLSGKKI
jgi:CPA2 family monovalent cation:H+ antiporter-2